MTFVFNGVETDCLIAVSGQNLMTPKTIANTAHTASNITVLLQKTKEEPLICFLRKVSMINQER